MSKLGADPTHFRAHRLPERPQPSWSVSVAPELAISMFQLWLVGGSSVWPALLFTERQQELSPAVAATCVVVQARPAAHKAARYRHTHKVIIDSHPTESAYST